MIHQIFCPHAIGQNASCDRIFPTLKEGGDRKGIQGDFTQELKVLFQENYYGKPYKKTLKRTENLAITFLLGN